MRIDVICKTLDSDGEFFFYESDIIPMVGDEIHTDAGGQDHIFTLKVESRAFNRIQMKHNPWMTDNTVILRCIDVS